MGTILSKRHFLANFDKQAIAVTEFTDFLSIYAMPRLGELLVATSLVLTASQEVNGTEDGGQSGKVWKRDMVFAQEFKKLGVIASLQYIFLVLLWWRGKVSQHDAFGNEDHLDIYILPNILLSGSQGSSKMLHIQGFYPHNYVQWVKYNMTPTIWTSAHFCM